MKNAWTDLIKEGKAKSGAGIKARGPRAELSKGRKREADRKAARASGPMIGSATVTSVSHKVAGKGHKVVNHNATEPSAPRAADRKAADAIIARGTKDPRVTGPKVAGHRAEIILSSVALIKTRIKTGTATGIAITAIADQEEKAAEKAEIQTLTSPNEEKTGSLSYSVRGGNDKLPKACFF